MSLFRTALRTGLLALALSGMAAVSACSSFRPVYGENGIASDRIALNYTKPASRLDQIVYQELGLRLGRSDSPDAPRLTVVTTASARSLTRTAVVKPQTQQEATVVATAVLKTADGRTVFTGERSASAGYTTVGQVLADTEAANEARERAAKAVAELLRLAILGALATPVQGQ